MVLRIEYTLRNFKFHVTFSKTKTTTLRAFRRLSTNCRAARLVYYRANLYRSVETDGSQSLRNILEISNIKFMMDRCLLRESLSPPFCRGGWKRGGTRSRGRCGQDESWKIKRPRQRCRRSKINVSSLRRARRLFSKTRSIRRFRLHLPVAAHTTACSSNQLSSRWIRPTATPLLRHLVRHLSISNLL